MLVLTRKQNEKIRIGDHITITVVRTKGKAVRLGIQAPENVSILRGELVFDVKLGEPSDASAGKRVSAREHGASNAKGPSALLAPKPGCQGPRAAWPVDASAAAAACGAPNAAPTAQLPSGPLRTARAQR